MGQFKTVSYNAGYNAGLMEGLVNRNTTAKNHRAEVAALKKEIQELWSTVADLRIDRNRLEWSLERAVITLRKERMALNDLYNNEKDCMELCVRENYYGSSPAELRRKKAREQAAKILKETKGE